MSNKVLVVISALLAYMYHHGQGSLKLRMYVFLRSLFNFFSLLWSGPSLLALSVNTNYCSHIHQGYYSNSSAHTQSTKYTDDDIEFVTYMEASVC